MEMRQKIRIFFLAVFLMCVRVSRSSIILDRHPGLWVVLGLSLENKKKKSWENFQPQIFKWASKGRSLHTFLGSCFFLVFSRPRIQKSSGCERILAACAPFIRFVDFLTHFFKAAFFMLDYGKKSFIIGSRFLARVFFPQDTFCIYVKMLHDKFFIYFLKTLNEYCEFVTVSF